MKAGYDEECEVLAMHFIGEDNLYSKENVKALAQHIQTAIEDWIAYQECGEVHGDGDRA